MAEFTQTTYPVDPEAGINPISIENKKQIQSFIDDSITIKLKNIPLTDSVYNDIDSSKFPYNQYAIEGNKVFLNLSLPLSSTKTGTITIGQLTDCFPSSNRRIPAFLHNGTDPEVLFGLLQIGTDGTINVIPVISSTSWNRVTANGFFII